MRDQDGSGVREVIKENDKKRILNISIGIIVLLIILVGGQLFLSGKTTETVGDATTSEESDLENQYRCGTAE
ncbi:hypothetical protein KHA80_04330 [Anaerobacillus sp. HL2]|nr:hypothetical protein KHA80_04330 [Anaerobacillus sp. HL2]